MRYVLDLKTGSDSPYVGPQTAAYVELAALDHRTTKRFALYLDEKSFHLEPCTAASDWPDFVACLRVHQLKQRNLH